MAWQKLGCFFKTDRQHPWMVSHACVPTGLYLPENDRIRIYFAPRNERGQSIPTYLEVDAADPTRVLYLHDRPILELGQLGTFDDGGIMPCSITTAENGDLYLYYVGWNPSVSVAYRNAVGLAISKDGGVTFERPFPGAVVDRSKDEPFFTASPCSFREGDTWHLWYASSTGFLEVNGRVEPLYEIKYAHSADGVEWTRLNQTIFAPVPIAIGTHECTARPSVVKDGDTYKMWFCYRGSYDYRNGDDAYRIGYAESKDARTWHRMDDRVGIDYSPTGWDSDMQTYPNVVDTPHGRYLFYNGNGFGATGIGCARWQNNTK
ncbi:glycoside hydrolase family protein [Neolewinella antarctica]|uniref:Uncharacterized protein n=1 Tax=Neolewinella antarctica TaxID=442734 RepID=A0ABX0XA72_9BACT|nr:hypothetical protein [Neolewinella antarctica]NJC26145.1 hypothetical protein [Neolewinella antarctica]